VTLCRYVLLHNERLTSCHLVMYERNEEHPAIQIHSCAVVWCALLCTHTCASQIATNAGKLCLKNMLLKFTEALYISFSRILCSCEVCRGNRDLLEHMTLPASNGCLWHPNRRYAAFSGRCHTLSLKPFWCHDYNTCICFDLIYIRPTQIYFHKMAYFQTDTAKHSNRAL
jgi:hypothetical protein